MKFTELRLRYPGRNKPYLQTKARNAFTSPVSPCGSRRSAASSRSTVLRKSERGREQERESKGGCVFVCVWGRESHSQSQRNEKDKGKTDGTIDLCVKKVPPSSSFSFSIYHQTKTQNRLLGWTRTYRSVSTTPGFTDQPHSRHVPKEAEQPQADQT